MKCWKIELSILHLVVVVCNLGEAPSKGTDATQNYGLLASNMSHLFPLL